MIRRARTLLLIILALAIALPALAETESNPFLDYRYDSWFLPQSPSVTGGPAAGLFNPAAWALNDKVAMDTWQILNEDEQMSNQFGTAFGRNLGFAMQTQAIKTGADKFRVFDYALGLSGGSRKSTIGLSYRWSTGDTDVIRRQATLAAGFISRPNNWTSLGASATTSLQSDTGQYIFDLGIRPFGRSWFSLFADWTADANDSFFNEGIWGAGAELRPFRGVHLGGRVREMPGSSDLNYSLFMGFTVSSGFLLGLPMFDDNGEHIAALPRYDHNGHHVNTTLLQRSSPPIPGLSLPVLQFGGPEKRYYPINLENRVLTYQKYRWFDETRVAWLDLLAVLNRVRDDENIDGVVVNLVSFRGRPSLIWELRQKLEEIKEQGKELIIHVDRPTPVVYYLASIADRISLDPWGNVALPGFALSRSYLKGTLEKLGVGFQEFRYFKYKSAAETFSRTAMSEADREQRQRIVDVIYEELRKDSARARGLSDADFDCIVDDLAILSPEEAFESGLVDVIGRWNELPKWLGEERNGGIISPKLKNFKRDYYDAEWGETLRIPVVFAVGSCAMDSGIRGRATSAYLRRLVNDPMVPAVVLRADSPGGDPLPSDLVADAVRQLKEAGKPVIISQGDVAASGGYWISMDGTEVLTTPLTITGSIGVIGGWLWDDGAAESAGISSDAVHRGKHAELMTTVQFPFLGGLPRRAMDQEELDRVEKSITTNYDQFVNAVAKGREMDPEEVGKIAQGRVWMGGDAVDIGLCDRFGTLDEAIELAKDLANIPDWRDVRIVEYPPRRGFAMPSLLPSIPSLMAHSEVDDEATVEREAAEFAALQQWMNRFGLTMSEVQFLRSISAAPGRPLLQISPDLLPGDWDQSHVLD